MIVCNNSLFFYFSFALDFAPYVDFTLLIFFFSFKAMEDDDDPECKLLQENRYKLK